MMNPSIPLTAPITNGSGFGGGCGNEFIWIFALLILGGGGFGGGFGNRNGEQAIDNFELGKLTGTVATKDSVQMLTNQMDNQFAQTQQNVFSVREQISNGLSTLGYEFANRIAALSTQMSTCCCEIKTMLAQGFGEVKYDMANFAAQINANQTAGMQRVLDALAADKADRQAQRIQALELEKAVCGLVRYPNATTYNAGGSPFCGGGCGCGY